MSKQAVVPSSLATLAKEINEEHRACLGSLRTGLDHARKAGETLAEAKRQVGHGNWLPWLSENFEGGRSTACGYMRIHERWDELTSNVQGLAHLGFEGALKLLASPREADKPLPAEQSLPPAVLDDEPRAHEAIGVVRRITAEPEPSDAQPIAPAVPCVPKGTRFPVSDAHQYASMAIRQLERIRDDDPTAIEQLDRVSHWIAERKTQ